MPRSCALQQADRRGGENTRLRARSCGKQTQYGIEEGGAGRTSCPIRNSEQLTLSINELALRRDTCSRKRGDDLARASRRRQPRGDCQANASRVRWICLGNAGSPARKRSDDMMCRDGQRCCVLDAWTNACSTAPTGSLVSNVLLVLAG